MTTLSPQLARLGDELEHACAANLAARPRRVRRTVLVAVVVASVLGGAAAVAAEQLSTNEVANSLPAGTAALIGTDPTCSVVKQDVEYRCVLAKPPVPEVSDWTGAAQPTVDATKHVNGGCRALTADGMVWECYIGQASVAEGIIDKSFLGAYAPEPGHG